MGKVIAGITTSVDGYVAGPEDGPGVGLGKGGERLHYWVFGGPWTYDNEPEGNMAPEDAAWMEEAMGGLGAVIAGRWTYEAADHWGDENPWGIPFFIVTHRPEEEPEGGAFNFVGSFVFEGFTQDVELEHKGARQSQYATFIDYVVKR